MRARALSLSDPPCSHTDFFTFVFFYAMPTEVTEFLRLPNEELGKSTFQSEPVKVGVSAVGFSAVLKGSADAKSRTEVLYAVIGKPVEGCPAHLALASGAQFACFTGTKVQILTQRRDAPRASRSPQRAFASGSRA